MREHSASESQDNGALVERAIAAINARDVDGYLSCCTDDVELRTPLASAGGVYEGPAGIRRFFDDIEDSAPSFRIEVRNLKQIGRDRVLVSIVVASSGRVSGLSLAAETTNLYWINAGRITRIEIYLDGAEALRAVDMPAQ